MDDQTNRMNVHWQMFIRVISSLGLVIALAILATLAFGLTRFETARADGILSVEILSSYNLVVDSNVESPSTYAPSVATVAGKFCNTGDTPLTDVQGYIGNFTASQPGQYPILDSATLPNTHPLYNTGDYSLSHMGGTLGAADAQRYVGDLAVGECKVQYWHFTYPQCENVGGLPDTPPCDVGPVWGATNDPDDDLSLYFDVWARGYDAGVLETASDSWTVTMRNEISALANKIKPNPDGQWFNTDTNIVAPGDMITTNGINYELGVINQGFDNDGDLIPDYNAWLQPIGDTSYDPSCFRLVQTSGVITVTRSGGNPDMVIPFVDQLYFTNLPQDNTGVTGKVYYKFVALSGPCSSTLTPYQEVASGYDNEKFSGDYGTGIPPVGSEQSQVTLDKSSSPASVPLGGTINYQIAFYNGGSTSAGLPLYNVPLAIKENIPAGTVYVDSSAQYTGAGSASILYSTDNGLTWISTPPSAASVTNLQWRLNQPLDPSQSGTASFSVTVPGAYSGSPFIENTACASFGDGASFACDSAFTMLQGQNSIGDRAWRDEDKDGVQDSGETTGLGGLLVSLYWDRDGDGVLDPDDPLITTQDTADGAYDFTGLPDAQFLVQVDASDPDVPAGYYLTTTGLYAVNLTSAGNIDYNDADFGFAPTLVVDKRLTSENPSYEGDLVTYEIDLTNTRPGNGTGRPTACTYTVWATIDHPNNTFVPPGGNQANARWQNTPYTRYSPDGLYATTVMANSADLLGMSGFNIGPQLGQITNVTLVLYLQELVNLQHSNNEYLDVRVWYNNVQTAPTYRYTGAGYFATGGTGTLYTLSIDVTANRPGGPTAWAWSDFSSSTNLTELQLLGNGANNNAGDLGLDAAAYVITTDQECGGEADTITYLPLTDDYDPARLEFIAADPSQSNIDTVNGLITWDNLGPLYAGQTKTVTLTFRALEPPDSDGDGENDPVTHQNDASVTGATFSDGGPVNDASDSVTHTINPTGTIGDTIWNDNGGPTGTGVANNGVQDGSEAGIPGVTVYLCTTTPCTGANAVSTQITDENGQYLFTGLRDGTYYVGVDTASLPGTTFTQTGDPDFPGVPCVGAQCDSQAAARVINNNDGNPNNDDYLAVDFGYRIPNTVFGSVWEDNDGDGIQDAGENGLPNVRVYLDDCGPDGICGNADDGPSIFVLTDSNGNYIFSDLPDGNYRVRVDTTTLPPGGTWSNTADPEGDNNGQTNVLAVSGGNLYGAYDFGYHQTGSSVIGDTLYRDWNANSAQDSGEEGIPGVTIYIYEDSNGDGIIDPTMDALVATTVTDGNGNYTFGGLPAGDYIVVVNESQVPADYLPTQDPDGGGDGRSRVTLDGVNPNLDQDFGYRPYGYGSIGDLVWQDNDGDGIWDAREPGIADITVNLYEDMDGNGVYNPGVDALIASTTTDANGQYSFVNLPAGDYLVDVDTADPQLPPGYVLSTANDPLAVNLTAAEEYLDADFGFAPGGVIGDFIWRDNDGNGTPDLGEPGIANVVVNLYRDLNNDGLYTPGVDTFYATDTTDANGLYEFTDLPSSDYVVVVASSNFNPGGALEGFTQTGDPDAPSVPCTSGGCDNQGAALDPRPDYDGLRPGMVNRSLDFGFQAPGTIGDYLWLDSDQDGVQDVGEAGIPNVTVRLYANGPDGQPNTADDVLVATTTTNAAGLYSFTNVPNGDYNVRVDTTTLPVPGMVQTYDPDGGSPDNIGLATVTNGSSNLDVDFGYRYDGDNSVSGTVFFDRNQSGGTYQSGTDGPFANITVYLYDGTGRLYATTTTDANGLYSFTDLPDGSYTIVVRDNAPQLEYMGQTSEPDDANCSDGGSTCNNRTTVNLAGGTALLNQDFGYFANMDCGDLPITYNASGFDTLLSDEGPCHARSTTLDPNPVNHFLGTGWDGEYDGQPDSLANGDDQDADGDDEDGITLVQGYLWQPGNTVQIQAQVNGDNAYLAAWFDWNNDGDFTGAGEENEFVYFGSLAEGQQTLNLTIPLTGGCCQNRPLNARFRLYQGSPAVLSPGGMVVDGEVEDYQLNFGVTAVDLVSLTARASAPGQMGAWLAVLLLFGSGSLLVLRPRRLRV
jgi:hypothetical protein